MSSSFFKPISYFFIFIVFLIVFVSCFSPIIAARHSSNTSNLNEEFIWPLPGYSYISSYFGYRNSPTAGASSYHSGMDIPAPKDTPILAVCSGEVTFSSWGAGGGYTIVVQNRELDISVSYCHVSPNFIVARGDIVKAGNIISNVGPKNVYGIINNPYKDSNGLPTNGATTGCHLHLTVKKSGTAVDPLNYFSVNS